MRSSIAFRSLIKHYIPNFRIHSCVLTAISKVKMAADMPDLSTNNKTRIKVEESEFKKVILQIKIIEKNV